MCHCSCTIYSLHGFFKIYKVIVTNTYVVYCSAVDCCTVSMALLFNTWQVFQLFSLFPLKHYNIIIQWGQYHIWWIEAHSGVCVCVLIHVSMCLSGCMYALASCCHSRDDTVAVGHKQQLHEPVLSVRYALHLTTSAPSPSNAPPLLSTHKPVSREHN